MAAVPAVRALDDLCHVAAHQRRLADAITLPRSYVGEMYVCYSTQGGDHGQGGARWSEGLCAQ